MGRVATRGPSIAVPADIQKGLSDALFADARSIAPGSILTAVAALLSWWSSNDASPLAIAITTGLVTFVRLWIAHARTRRLAEQRDADLTSFDRIFMLGGLAYLLCNGALVLWAFLASDDPFILTIALMMALTNAVSIAIRSFAVTKVALYQMICIIGPTAAAFAIRGGLFWFAAATQLVLAWFIHASAARLRNILLSEMNYRRRSDTVAEQFNFAINNMSHGMCMIDREMRIVVSNGKLAEYFRLPSGRSLDSVKFTALVRMTKGRGIVSAEAAQRLLSSFTETHTKDGVVCTQIKDLYGTVYDLTLKSHAAGGWVLVMQDVTEQQRAQEALDFAARFDPVTGLPNRRSFELKLGEALVAARNSEARTEVLFLDLDGFKQINDTLGHKIGDRVLSEAGRRLSALMGISEYVSRWGGDEFVILRSGVDEDSVRHYAEGIISELSRPAWIDGTQVVVGASVGVAVCVGGTINMDALLQQADMALYSAKRENRGGCRIYELAMSEQAHERRLLELDLQAALASHTFELHYQPIVDIETGDLVSFEALARWRHPVRGQVSPALFVPVLEELNLMNAFGAWTLQRACEDAAKWPLPIRVGVNVSSRQLDTLTDSVRRALTVSGLQPGRLELEITETAALAAGDSVGTTLENLRARGVRIALDDFGTGYSSLSHLMRLPLDKVKIDRSFTQQLGKSRKADVLVANISRLSSQLGMRVTFEGIETADQLERVRALGIAAEGQGWLFGKPTAASELSRLFEVEHASEVA
jgi:diguanylate cyclase (GGDEF)-like protein